MFMGAVLGSLLYVIQPCVSFLAGQDFVVQCVVGITHCSQRAMFSAYQRLEEEEGARQCSVW